MSMVTESLPAWTVQKFPPMPEGSVTKQEITEATLSAAESGSIYWDQPAPRSYVRGAVYDAAGKLCVESQRMGGVNADLVISVNPPILSRKERDSAAADRLAGHWLYAGSWMHGFGHFLVETLPTLWPMLEDGAEFDGICAHRFNSTRLHDWQFEILQLLTDKEVRVVTEGPSSVEKLTVPTRPYHYQRAISPLAGRVWTAIGEHVDGDEGKPVYFSRTQFNANLVKKTGREYANSEEVDALFRSRGFDVLFPETMSATEQIRVARTAPVIAGQAGSALHLSAFMKPGGRVLEVADSRSGSALIATQRAISAVRDQPVALIPYRGDDAGNLDITRLGRSLSSLGVQIAKGPSFTGP
jgi:hypothetical protein